MQFQRYAIYYAPEPGPLARFAAAWLGWDASAGCDVAPLIVEGLPKPIAEITGAPRKYGFHGTVKPPFRLADGKRVGDLRLDLERLAQSLAPVTLEGLELTKLGRFLALTPIGNPQNLAALAEEVVKSLDTYRMQPTGEELEKRRRAGLSARQEANLTQWGYPYVLKDYRFHMTLTDRLSKADAAVTHDVLSQVLAPLLPRPFMVNSLCLFGEADDGQFHLIERFPLSGQSATGA